MEALFVLAATSQSADFTQRYQVVGELEIGKMIRKARQANAPTFQTLLSADRDLLDARLNEIEALKEELNPKRITVEQIAKEAGLQHLYLGPYSLLCATVHAHARDLERDHFADGEELQLTL